MFWVVGCLLRFDLLSSQKPQDLQLLAVWLAVFLISILWHELGHAFAMRRYGGRPEVLLYGMGGLCSSAGRYTRKQSIIISAAGPAAGFVLALIVIALSQSPLNSSNFLVREALGQLVIINIFWSAMNLLPIQPLDGGHILRSFMSHTEPAIVPKVGMVTAGIVAILSFVLLNSPYMAVLFGYLAYQNWKMTQGPSHRRPF